MNSQPLAGPHCLQDQVEHIFAKEKENAKNTGTRADTYYSVAVMEQHSHQLEESWCCLHMLITSAAEPAETEAYGWTRPKTTKRVQQWPAIAVEAPIQLQIDMFKMGSHWMTLNIPSSKGSATEDYSSRCSFLTHLIDLSIATCLYAIYIIRLVLLIILHNAYFPN